MNHIARTDIPPAPAPAACDRNRAMHQIDRLFRDLEGRDLPLRTARLMSAAPQKKARKLVEEAAELAIDAVNADCQGVIAESADLLYHLVVIWRDLDIDPHEIWTEMARRAWTSGLAGERAKDGGKLADLPGLRRRRRREIGPLYLRRSRGTVR